MHRSFFSPSPKLSPTYAPPSPYQARKHQTKKDIPIAVIRPTLTPQKLLLPLQIGIISSHLISIFFRLQQRCEVDSRPHLFAGHFDLFALAEEDLPPAVGHYAEDADEVPERAEAAGGDVALGRLVLWKGKGRGAGRRD
jgi:hypothetical protein